MSDIVNKCECGECIECENKELKFHAVCSAMPVNDAFTNSNTIDRLILSRKWINPDPCGRLSSKCQSIEIDLSHLIEFLTTNGISSSQETDDLSERIAAIEEILQRNNIV